MYNTFITSALIISFVALQAVAQFSVQTPTLKQCEKATIRWSGEKGQALVSIVKSEDPCGDALVDLPEQDGNSLQWRVTLPAGSKVQVAVEDDSDDVAWSGIVTVEDSDNDSCLPAGTKKKPAPKAASASSTASQSATLVISGTQPAAPAADPAATAGAAGSTGAASPAGGLGANNVGGLGQSSGALSQIRAPALWLSTALAAVVFSSTLSL